MLIASQIAKLPPGRYADKDGLYLRVSPNGKRVWARRVKGSLVKVGDYPSMSLADARRCVTSTDLKTDEAIKAYMKTQRVRRPDLIEALLAPLNTPTPIAIHTKASLMKQLQDYAKHAPVKANKMVNKWKDFFDYCEQSGHISNSPLAGVRSKYVGHKEARKKRNLSWEELVVFIRSLHAMTPDTALALYMILATGMRSSEVLWIMRHRQLNNVPTKEHPDPAIHNVPAVPHTKALLKRKYNVPASHMTLGNALRRRNADFTPHDLRRTFASRMADLGVAPHVIEKLLDHKMVGMMAVYNHAEYWPERVAAMRLWGRKLSELRRLSKASPA